MASTRRRLQVDSTPLDTEDSRIDVGSVVAHKSRGRGDILRGLCWIFLVLVMFSAYQSFFGSGSSMPIPEDTAEKYDVLSSWVRWTNQVIWSSKTAGDTMHQAIGNPPKPETLNSVVRDESIRLLKGGCGGDLLGPIRIFDAGSGWGGTSFELDKALNGHDHHIDGVTLSKVQFDQADAAARERGLGENIKFHLRSYDEGPITKGETYDLALSIEALIHSRDVGKTLKTIGSTLAPTSENGCHASHLIVVEDILVDESSLQDANVLDYKSHWAGWSFAEFPLTEPQWRTAFSEHGGLDANTLTFVDLGKTHGLRLHGAALLAFLHAAVKTAYTAVKTLGLSRSVESYLSSYVGCYAREKLLVAGALKYALISASRVQHKSTSNKHLLQSSSWRPKLLESQCTGPEGTLAPSRRPLSNFSRIPGRHLHRPDGCISSVLCCGQAPPSLYQGRGDSGSSTVMPAGPQANAWKYSTGDYMKVFAKHMTHWFSEVGPTGKGTFLDVGGTGNTKAGMKQTAFKFAQFAGPLEYWVQDVDARAAELERSFVCDIARCPEIPSCSFDVVFSHVVLEHVREPWAAVDTLRRITKPGGLSLHVVPFVHRYESLLPHYFHFTHQGLSSLFEDRGFEVLEVGYDFCVHDARKGTKKKKNARSILSHEEAQTSPHLPSVQLKDNWLVYIVARRLSTGAESGN